MERRDDGAISTELFGHLNEGVVVTEAYFAAVGDMLVGMSGLRDAEDTGR